MRKGFKVLLAEANAKIKTISPEAAQQALADPEVVFVDLREPNEREREGVIPGSVSCPRGMLEFYIDPESPYHKPAFAADKRYVFFCAAGSRSALATATAQEMGLDHVSHIGGGFGAWKKEGRPVAALDGGE